MILTYKIYFQWINLLLFNLHKIQRWRQLIEIIQLRLFLAKTELHRSIKWIKITFVINVLIKLCWLFYHNWAWTVIYHKAVNALCVCIWHIKCHILISSLRGAYDILTGIVIWNISKFYSYFNDRYWFCFNLCIFNIFQ